MLAQASSLVPLVYLLSTSVDACAIGAQNGCWASRSISFVLE